MKAQPIHLPSSPSPSAEGAAAPRPGFRGRRVPGPGNQEQRRREGSHLLSDTVTEAGGRAQNPNGLGRYSDFY